MSMSGRLQPVLPKSCELTAPVCAGDGFITLAGDEGIVAFDDDDVATAFEWAASTPGLGGWQVLLETVDRPRMLSILPPGAEVPAFFVFRKAGTVAVVWFRSRADEVVEVGRFAGLRPALLTLCPIQMDEDRPNSGLHVRQ